MVRAVRKVGDRCFNHLPPHPTCDPELPLIRSTNSSGRAGHWAAKTDEPEPRLPALRGWVGGRKAKLSHSPGGRGAPSTDLRRPGPATRASSSEPREEMTTPQGPPGCTPTHHGSMGAAFTSLLTPSPAGPSSHVHRAGLQGPDCQFPGQTDHTGVLDPCPPCHT